jgi:hypothetical protein
MKQIGITLYERQFSSFSNVPKGNPSIDLLLYIKL